MAQTESPCKVAYPNTAKLSAGTGGTKWGYIALAEADFTCDEDFTQFGAAGADEHDDGGLARVAATISTITTTVTDDTIKAIHTFTASAERTVYGFAVFNNAAKGQGDCLLCCKFGASITLAIGRTLIAEGDAQIKKSS